MFPGSMAYLFMADAEGDIATWDPDAGENALLIQPGEQLRDCIQSPTGPTLFEVNNALGNWPDNQVPSEYEVELIQGADTDPPEEGAFLQNKLGGVVNFYQGEPGLEGGPWILLMQLNDSDVPFCVNFGTGTGYALISADGRRGKFLWQC